MSNYIVTTIYPDYLSETHTVTNVSAQSSVITTGSGLVRIATTTGVHIRFGTNPSASVEDLLIPEHHVEIFSFKSGDKVAFIKASSSSGDLSICAVD